MELYWEDDYAVARALIAAHPGVAPLEIDGALLHSWIIALPGFADDKTLTAQYLLENIQREWYEEVASHDSV